MGDGGVRIWDWLLLATFSYLGGFLTAVLLILWRT